jgi:SAM-dependent methyltransferase
MSLSDRFGSMPWRLNLGCGFDRKSGFINIDRETAARPDMLFDIEAAWPLPASCVLEIEARHIVEHIHDLKRFFQEAWRVMCHDGVLRITVPHQCSDFFWGDPTHVRPITELTLMLLSRKACAEYMSKGYSNTPLAVYWGVDFETDNMELAVTDKWKPRLQTTKEVTDAMATFNNVVSEITFTMRRMPG